MSALARTGGKRVLVGGDEVTPQIGGDFFGGDEPNAIGGDEGPVASLGGDEPAPTVT
jgi:hypothetical protein